MGNSQQDTIKMIREPGKAIDITHMSITELAQIRIGLLNGQMIKIIVEEENLASWIVLNNTFTRIGTSTWDTAKDYWNGVLFQLGGFYGLDTDTPMFNLKKIVFEKADGTEVAVLDNSNDEFSKKMYWINVVAKKSSGTRRDPMQLHDLSRLKLDPPEPIHQYFQPYMGGLTFWHDREDGYTMEATKNLFHNRYTFGFEKTDKLEIKVYENDTLLEDYATKEVTTIRLVGPAGGDPQDALNPPQRPIGVAGKSG